MTTAATVLNDLDTLIAQRSILQHPFYRAWTMGALTREDLAVYARVYYPHVAAFPEYLRTAIADADADIDAVKETLEENLRDELSVPAPHTELWLRFAEAVGAGRNAVRHAAPTTGAAQVTESFRRLCAGGSVRALSALYAYESQQPAVAVEKIRGLQQHYGIADEQALTYFTVHAEADIAHRDGERRALEACLEAGANREEILNAAEQALDAYWHLLDAVCAERRSLVS
jgi:pyrroloquinoline-quinone synthase